MQKIVLFTGEDEPKVLAALAGWMAEEPGRRHIAHSRVDLQIAAATNKDVGMKVDPRALTLRQETIARLYCGLETEVVQVA